MLLCSSTHMLAGLDRTKTKGGHIPTTKNRGVGCLPTPPVTTLMKQKTVKKTSTPGQLSVQLESWKVCCKTWQIRLTPTGDFKRKIKVSVCSRREWKPTSRRISCTKNAFFSRNTCASSVFKLKKLMDEEQWHFGHWHCLRHPSLVCCYTVGPSKLQNSQQVSHF